ncbi:MAG: hypothetical protein K2X86_07180, partial [Cytophagaceae bacterium]|nr:hypothetical protein [Cytophagaceae bacterium]
MKKFTKSIFALIIICCVCYSPLMAQKKKSSSSGKNFGIGLRAGDPMGISAKKYMGNNKALELSIGKTAFWDRYDYEDRFYDNDDYKGKGYRFYGYKKGSALSLQLHYLIHKDIKGLDGLQWYFGPGAQFRTASRTYVYEYKVFWGPNPDDYYWDFR